MRRLVFFIGAVAALSFVGCGPRRYSPVEISADDFDVTPLVGRWAGEYHSDDTGRSGTITFTLLAGEGSAYGDVMMIPKTATRSVVPVQGNRVGVAAQGTVRELLTIHLVRKEGSQVVGTLDPYQDPECHCPVTTIFQGTFKDAGTIEGTFRTQGSDQITMRADGVWKVTRVKRL